MSKLFPDPESAENLVKRFKEEHKKVFKDVAGDLLVRLGYEKDKNW